MANIFQPITDTALQLAKLNQNKQTLGVERDRIKALQKQATITADRDFGLAERRVGVREQGAETATQAQQLTGQKEQTRIAEAGNYDLLKVTPIGITKTGIMYNEAFGSGSVKRNKAFTDWGQSLSKRVNDSGGNSWDAYQLASSESDYVAGTIVSQEEQAFNKKAEETPGWIDTQEAKQRAALIEQAKTNPQGVIDTIFAKTIKSRQARVARVAQDQQRAGQFSLGPEATRFGPQGDVIARGATKKPSGFTEYIIDGELVSLPNNQQPPPGAVKNRPGFDIEVGPEGTRIKTGVSGVGGRDRVQEKVDTQEGKRLATEISKDDEKIFGLMRSIETFDDEYLTFAGKTKGFLLGIKEKAGFDLDPDQKDYVAKRAAFLTNAFDGINKYIRDITGAAMSEPEAKRILKGMPDPANDSPTEFRAKAKAVLRKAFLSKVRHKISQEEGFSGSLEQMEAVYGLDGAEKFLDDKAKSLEADANNLQDTIKANRPDMPQEEIDNIVEQQMTEKYKGWLEPMRLMGNFK